MGDKKDVWQGTLALMILKTLEAMGPLHGYGIARRIEQTSGNLLSLNYGTLYPALLKLEQEGAVASEWGASENNRKAKFYRLTRSRAAPVAGGDPRLGADHGNSGALSVAARGPGMNHLRAWLLRFTGIFTCKSREHEMAEELESHLQMHIADNLRAGMSPEEARRVAMVALGGVENTKQAYRDRSTIPWIESLMQDLRFARRQLISILASP